MSLSHSPIDLELVVGRYCGPLATPEVVVANLNTAVFDIFRDVNNAYTRCGCKTIRAKRVKNIGEGVKRRRVELGLNQGDLAEKSGVNAVTISQIERGANTTTETLQKLAEAMDTTLPSLFCPTFDDDAVERLVLAISQKLRPRISEVVKNAVTETLAAYAELMKES